MSPRLDSPEHIQAYVLLLLKKHGLDDWNFRWDKARRRLGSCNCTKKTISLSAYFVALNPEKHDEILDTIRHELAHALAWKEKKARGHGKVWKEYCSKLGAKPQSKAPEGAFKNAPYKYVLRLQGSNQIIAGYYRRPAFARNIRKLMLKGQPETLGKLELVRVVEGNEST